MENNEIEVLLIEDNLDDAELTIRALRKNKNITTIVHVKDGAEAIDFVFCEGQYQNRPMTNRPQVILLDLNMPKISGTDVLKKIKGDKRTRAIPVVVLTSSKESPDVETCYGYGANSYIVKPVGYDNFMQAVKDIGIYWLERNQR